MKRLMLCLVVLATIGLAGCTPGGNESITVQSPRDGQIFKIGEPVTIAWTCHDCDLVAVRKVVISLWPAGGGQVPFSYDVTEDLLSGSIVWNAGTTKGGVASPGVYFLTFSADCSDGYSGGGCGAQSGTFKLIL